MKWGWAVLTALVLAVAAALANSPRAATNLSAPLPPPAEGANVCEGTSFPQTVTDVTSKISQVAPGVHVTQLTSEGVNFITYVDVPAYSAAGNVIVYNNLPRGVVTAAVNGSHAQIVAGPATAVHLSWDGNLATFTGPGHAPRLMDIFGVRLTKPGPCAKYAVTTSGYEINPGAGPLKMSLPVSSGDKQIIAIAPTHYIQRVRSDGTFVDPDPGVDPDDLYHGHAIHRLRLNPKFTQWVIYSRNAGPGPRGTPENWLFNFETRQVCSVAALGVSYGHDSWSADGTRLGLDHGPSGTWHVATIFDSHGKLLGDCSGAKYAGFEIKTIGENIVSHRAGLAANFCAWPPDDAPVFVCVSARMTGLKIYLLAMDGHAVKFLTNTDSSASSDKGIPVAVFAQDSRHILFRSDRSGTPEVYMITGFTPSVP